MSVGILGVQFNNSLISLRCFCTAIETQEYIPQIVVYASNVWIESNSPLQKFYRCLCVSQLKSGYPEKVYGVYIIRSLFENTRIELGGAFNPPFVLKLQ